MRTATSSTEKHERRRCAGGPRGGDQLRGVPAAPPPLLDRGRSRGDLLGARLDDGEPLLRHRLRQHRGRLAGGARQPHRGDDHRARPGRRIAGRDALRRHGLQAGQPTAGRRRAGHGHAGSGPLAAAGAGADRELRTASPCPARCRRFIGPHWGHVAAFALSESSRGHAHRPWAATTPGRSGGRGVQADRARPDPALEQRARSRRRGRRSTSARARWETTRWGRWTGTATTRTRRPGSRTRPTASCARTTRASLAEFWADGPKSETPPGHWNTVANEVSDSSALDATDRRPRQDAEPARVGREALPRAQRRRARRRRCRLGCEGLLRLGAADLDDPLHGRQGPVERSRRARLRSEGPAARARPRRGDHRRVERAGPAARAPGRIIAARSPSRRGAGTPRIPRRSTAESAGSWPSTGCRISCRPSSRPAFAGYVSGHSTFSRAAAEVLTAFTGDPFFPGGLYELAVRPGRPEDGGRAGEAARAAVGDVLRRSRSGRDLAALHGHPHLRRTTSKGGRSARAAGGTPGGSRSATTTERRASARPPAAGRTRRAPRR